MGDGNFTIPTTATGIAKLYGTTPQNVDIDTKGNITIEFRGKKQVLTAKDIERYAEADYLVNQDKYSDDPAAKERAKRQAEVARCEISPDGKTVTFTIKNVGTVNVEEFKDLFNIADGAFREEIKDRHFEKRYSNEYNEYDEVLPNYSNIGDETVYPDGFIERVIDDAGHLEYDYRGYHLEDGESYDIRYNYINDRNRKDNGLFGWGFWGL